MIFLLKKLYNIFLLKKSCNNVFQIDFLNNYENLILDTGNQVVQYIDNWNRFD